MTKILIHSVFLISIAFAIGKNTEVELPNDSFQKKTEKLTFEKDIKPIMNTYCSGVFCHHGKPSTWTQYKAVKIAVKSGVFEKRVIEEKSMPKRKKLPQKEYDTIKKWLKEGAKEK